MTREHVIRDCQAFTNERRQLWIALGSARSKATRRSPVEVLMADRRATQPLLDFIRQTEIGKRRNEDESEENRRQNDDDWGWRDDEVDEENWETTD